MPKRVATLVFWLSALVGAHSLARCRADYLVASRPANLKADPSPDGKVLAKVHAADHLVLVDKDQSSGYYRVRSPHGGPEGWVYRTFVRRFRGDIPNTKSADPALQSASSEDTSAGATADTGTAAVAAPVQDHVYLGILHSHTSYSDGSGFPEDAYKRARAAGLDFLAITEHNHAKQIKPKDRDGVPIGVDHKLYNGTADSSLLSTARRMTENGRFVAMYGQEFSTIFSGNHANVFDIDEVITVDSGRFDLLVDRWLPGHVDSLGKPAIMQFNHPSRSLRTVEYGRQHFGSDENWLKEMSRHVRLIEVLNGPGLKKSDGQEPTVFESDFKYYLNLGFRVGPTGDQDNHYRTWGTLTDARTGIVAPELTKAQLLEAMRARHVFATEDKNLRAVVRYSYPGMPPGREAYLAGDVIDPTPPAGTKLTITYSLKDDDEPDAEYLVEVFADTVGGDDLATVMTEDRRQGNTPDGHPGTVDEVEYAGGAQYIYVRFTQTDEDDEKSRLWTAPIWFGSQEAGSMPLPAAVDEKTFVASKRSKVYHVDPSCRDAQQISDANRVTGHAATEGRTAHKGCPR